VNLPSGSRLGAYEVIKLLGVGGMGEVYRARDTRLERHVALKLVLEPFLADRERTLRFEREAKTLASLNHPNIATLHGIEQADGRHFLVMELVDGETLGERIARHPAGLPLEDALQIAKQIAEALEAAHEKGIVHRDLKPANVKITPDDKVKVLDFGLARVTEPQGTIVGQGFSPATSVMNSPTMSGLGTQAGVILGTASYMSPEQARGYTADHRSDIFSFGIVLYEMLSGRSAFPGDTISDVLASVLAREPDLSALPRDVAPRLTELIKRCLEKNPKRRWQAIGDVRYEIESLLANPRAVPQLEAPSSTAPAQRPLWRRALPLAATAVAGALLAAGAMQLARRTPPPLVTRFALTLPTGQAIIAATQGSLAISPDGTRIGYIANRQIFVRTLQQLEMKRIFDNDELQTLNNLVFSPDGQSVAFYHGGAIKKMSADGGPALSLASYKASPRGISWSGDALLFSVRDKIVRIAATGGTPETLIELSANESASNPRWLPDGKTILFTLAATAGDDADAWEAAKVVAQRPGESNRTVVLDGASDGRFVASGHLVYAQRGVLFAAPFDPKALKVLAPGVPVLEGVRRGFGAIAIGSAIASVSDNGTLVYQQGPVIPSLTPQLTLSYFDRSGGEQPLKVPAGPYSEPRVSPDGRYLAYGSDDGRDVFIWVYDLKAGGSPRRLTFGGRDRYPAWSADSRRVTFQSDRDGSAAIYWQPADGSGVAERLTAPAKGRGHVPLSWSADGVLLFDESDGKLVTLMALTLRDKSAQPFGNVRSLTPTGAIFSPNGRWVAYSAREGSSERQNVVFVQPYPATGALFQVSKSTEDGHHHAWATDGTELYYTPGPGNLIIAVPVRTTPAFALGEPANLPRAFTNNSPLVQRTFDTASQARFLGLIGYTGRTDSAGQGQLQVVLNWFEDLRNR
jgi:serine/threonine protein kinase/Tol biopolymer transport system component